MTPPQKSTIVLSGPQSDRVAALGRAGAAVEAELARRYPASDGYVHTRPDESDVARQQGQVFRETRKARRGRFGVHAGLLATSHDAVLLVTQQDSALAPAAIYALMGLGAVGGIVLLVSQRPDLPIGGLAFWAFIGLCIGGGIAIGLDRALQPKVAPDHFSQLHADLKAAIERAVQGE